MEDKYMNDEKFSYLNFLGVDNRKPVSGDIFFFQRKNSSERFFFGRVFITNAKVGGSRDFESILIYIYNKFSDSKLKLPFLDIKDLLIPPISTNATPWKHGYFNFVKNEEIKPENFLEQHCFVDYRGIYFDEYGNRLPGPIEPLGQFSLTGALGMEIKIGLALEALGL